MNILLVDDHALLRDSLALLLEEKYGQALSLLQAENGQMALDIVGDHPNLDLILLDMALPDMHGFQVLQQLDKTAPDIPVITLSGIVNPAFIRQSLGLGVSGFIPKTATGKTMLAAIDLVLSGGTYIPDAVLPNVHDQTVSPILTGRQLDVLRLMRQGLSNDEIASVLDISITTVKTHVHSILASLDVKNRTEAVHEAQLLHLL